MYGRNVATKYDVELSLNRLKVQGLDKCLKSQCSLLTCVLAELEFLISHVEDKKESAWTIQEVDIR